jgi:flagellar biosynthesis protein FlhF
MRIKKFTGSSLPEALAAVKAEMGDSAVLLKTRALDVRTDGRRGFEVTAAHEPDPVRAPRASASEVRAALAPAAPDLLQPVAAIPLQPAPDGPLQPARVVHCLVSRGVDELLARRLAEAWQKKSRPGARFGLESALAALIPVVSPFKIGSQLHVIAMVGPTGAGKTTTLAKLAAHFVLEKKLKVQLLTADTHRIAAVEQLAAFARLLKVDLTVGYDAQELAVHREACRAQVLLVDTPGVGPLDDAGLDGLKRCVEAVRPDATQLCLPAPMRTADLKLSAARFTRMGCDRIVFTKLDESATAGQLLSALAETRLPVSCWTTGQVVPGDLEPASGEGFARLILGGHTDAQRQRLGASA